MAKGHKGHHHRKARGGSIGEEKGAENDFTPAAPTGKEAKATDSGFKKGGKVGGKKSHSRGDRKPRKSGGRCMASGGSVMSAASKTNPAKSGGTMVDA